MTVLSNSPGMKHLILAVQLGGAKAADVVHLLATGQSCIHRDADVPHAATRLDCIATDASCLLEMNSEFNRSYEQNEIGSSPFC